MLLYEKNINCCFLLLGCTLIAQAQPKKVVADKIAAVVGDRIILHSDIINSILDIVAPGWNDS